jgi:plastocyanin
MNTLDSRSLRTGDCFGQKFPVAGEIRYFVSAGGELVPGADQRSEGGYLITVKPAAQGASQQQHNVHVTRKGNKLEASPAKLEIQAGDGVLWYTTDPAVSGFHVAGAGKDFQFSSASIGKDAIYTHVFGLPGKYDWRDPHGSGIEGSIEVENAIHRNTDERSQWYESLKKPATFEIKGGKSSPKSVKIVVGQTVFWSISEGKGVAITDSRMLTAPTKRK